MCWRTCGCDQRRPRYRHELSLLDDLRSDDLAGTAPGSEAVEDHEAGLVTNRLVEGCLATGLLAAVRRDNDVATAFETRRIAQSRRGETYVWRLWTPVSDILAVLEKNFCVRRGRYRFAVDVGLIEAVCRRAEVSSVLAKRDVDGVNMVYVQQKR
jgi:hypothetical protein